MKEKKWYEITAEAHCAASFALDVLCSAERGKYGYPLRPDWELAEARETLRAYCERHNLDSGVTLACVKVMSKHNVPLAWYLPEHLSDAQRFLRAVSEATA